MTRFHSLLLATSLTLGLGTATTDAIAGGGSNLIVSDFGAATAVASPGEQLAVWAELANAGLGDAEPSRLKYYFSADELYDSGDHYLNYDNVDGLAPAQTALEDANVRVPAGTPDGQYYVLLIADFDDDVVESEEQDNVVALAVTVQASATVSDADLAVQDAELNAVRGRAGEVVASDCQVRNLGTGEADATRLKYYLSTDELYDGSDRYLNYDAVGVLSAGEASAETANLRIPSDTADGIYYVLFVADQTEVIAESDESDNVVARRVVVGDVQLGADLVVHEVAVQTQQVRPGDALPISALVSNVGNESSVDTKLKYYLSRNTELDGSDKQLSYDKVDALTPGATSAEDAALRLKASTAGGAWFVLLVADAEQVSDELREDNNVVAVPVEVVLDDPDAFKADLVVTDVLAASHTAAPGSKLHVVGRVINVGPAPAEASRLKYFFSTDPQFDPADRYLNYDNVGALPSGASSEEESNLTIPADAAQGDYFLLVVADETEEVDERYETNNVVALQLTVDDNADDGDDDSEDDPDSDEPDLMVGQASVQTAHVKAGERAALSLVVENNGLSPAPASVVKYYLSRDERLDPSDRYSGYDSVAPLASGEASAEDATPLVPETTAYGTWYLLLVADAVDEVEESYESNNVTTVAIEVLVDEPEADRADLLVGDFETDKAGVEAGRKLGVDLVVHNAGSQPAAASRLKLYLSSDERYDGTDTYLDYRRVRALGVSESQPHHSSVRIPTHVDDGLYFVLAVLDTGREVAEQYESNNVVALPVEVGLDDGPTPAFPYACPDTVWTDSTLLGKHTVASLNALHLGWDNSKDMLALACIVSHFDLVGLVEIDAEAGLVQLEATLEALTGEAWSYHISDREVGNENGKEFYGFVWRDAEVQLLSPVGFFDDPGDLIKREPYGANFKMGAFDFTFVVFHQRYGDTMSQRRAEAQHLVDIYEYFQATNGAEGDVLIGGDFNLPGDDWSFTVVGFDGVTYITDPEQKTSIGTGGLTSSFDNIFYPASRLSELVESGAHDFTKDNHALVRETVSDHIPVWTAFDTAIDDD